MGREGHPPATPATATPCPGEATAATGADVGPMAAAGGSHLARVVVEEEEDGHRCAESPPPPCRGLGTDAVAASGEPKREAEGEGKRRGRVGTRRRCSEKGVFFFLLTTVDRPAELRA